MKVAKWEATEAIRTKANKGININIRANNSLFTIKHILHHKPSPYKKLKQNAWATWNILKE